MTKTQEIASEFVKRYPTLFKEDTEWWTERIVELLVGEFEHIREQAAKHIKGYIQDNIADWWNIEVISSEECGERAAALIQRMTPP